MLSSKWPIGPVLFCVVISLMGCAANPTTELEGVARDWTFAIRASQVVPVYPLTEDIQPGDVFLVPASISQQTKTFEAKGFLPIEQLVTRLKKLDYEEFYAPSYFSGTFSHTPHRRPGRDFRPVRVPQAVETALPAARRDPADQTDAAVAPRVAFPSYTFDVRKASGLKLAIPIQGIPVGLGLMGASAAKGSVSIKDAYTYGVDSATIAARLKNWVRSAPQIRHELSKMALQSNAEIYLRAVTRVYLTGSVVVRLTNQETTSSGVDVGAASGVPLPDLSGKSSEEARAALDSYKLSLQALSQPLNELQDSPPGGSFRFVEANQRAVTLVESFPRPLVVGYAGFDVRVFDDGSLSAPIPSFAVLSGAVQPHSFAKAGRWSPRNLKMLSAYNGWLGQADHWNRVEVWLVKMGHSDVSPTDLLLADHDELLWRANRKFEFLKRKAPP